MPPLIHERGTHVTVGGQSKLTAEEREALAHAPRGRRGGGAGNSQARGPGAGRPRKDGSPPNSTPAELKPLRNRAGGLPASILRGPPSAEEIAAFEAKWGERPDDRLHPLEVWDQLTLPILPFDMDLAKEVCDRLAEGQTIPWMVRNWARFPGTRNWRSWQLQPEVREYRDACLEARAEAVILAGQDILAHTHRTIEQVEASHANAVVNAARYLADMGLKSAQALAPRRFGQQLNVRSESTIEHRHGLTSGAAELLESFRRSSRVLPAPVVIEGEVLGEA